MKSHYDETDDIREFWDARHREWELAPNWSHYPHMQAWFEERFEHLLPPIRMEIGGNRPVIGRVLDYGCGAGLYALPLAKRFRDYVGFDTSASAIRIARQYHHKLKEFSRMSFEIYAGPPGMYGHLSPGQFDYIMSITVLQHQPVAIRRKMIENIQALLKPGGRYIGLEMQGDTQAYDMPQFPESAWIEAWKPLQIWKEAPPGHPNWIEDNVWVADKPTNEGA